MKEKEKKVNKFEKLETATKKQFFAWYRKYAGKYKGKDRVKLEEMAQRFYWHDIVEDLWNEDEALRTNLTREMLDQMTWDEAWFMLHGRGYGTPNTFVEMESDDDIMNNFIKKHSDAITAEYDSKADKVRARYHMKKGSRGCILSTVWYSTVSFYAITDRAPGIPNYLRSLCDLHYGRKTEEDLDNEKFIRELKWIRREEVKKEQYDAESAYYDPFMEDDIYDQVEEEFKNPDFVKQYMEKHPEARPTKVFTWSKTSAFSTTVWE